MTSGNNWNCSLTQYARNAREQPSPPSRPAVHLHDIHGAAAAAAAADQYRTHARPFSQPPPTDLPRARQVPRRRRRRRRRRAVPLVIVIMLAGPPFLPRMRTVKRCEIQSAFPLTLNRGVTK